MRTPRLPALLLAAALAWPLLAPGAGAQSLPAPPMPWPPVSDQVSLTLSAEEWVKTETALVTLAVNAAGDAADAAGLRTSLLSTARAVSDQGEWRIVQMDRRQDEAGLERWTATLEARLPESQLSGLAEKTRKASRPGLQVRVAGVRFDPTLAEMEATRSALRGRIYAQVTAELAALNQAFGDRQFRIASVDFFDSQPVPEPQPRLYARAAAAESMPQADLAEGVQEKVVLTARVTLGAFASPPAGTP